MEAYVPLGAKEIVEIQQLFEKVVVPVLTGEHAQEDGRAGAVLNVRSPQDETLIQCRAGVAPEDKFLSFEENAGAKNDALQAYPDLLTSWEVHRGNITMKPYPGAIRTPQDDRFSISGFSWQRDTIGCLWLAYRLGRIGIRDAADYANICGVRPQFLMTSKKMSAQAGSLLKAAA